jgi:hypothetical protein
LEQRLIEKLFGLIVGPWLDRARRTGRPVTWKPPLSLLNKQLPWTMRELHPRVTSIRGNSAIQFREFELVFEHFSVRIVLSGSKIDEILLVGPGESWGTRIDDVQRELVLMSGNEGEIQPLILSYSDLDAFLSKQHEALNKYYSNGNDSRTVKR